MDTAPTVLVVEDETSLREMTKDSLEDNGYTVFEAGDGVQALIAATSTSQT